jgi:predicted CxxxxCH...CXXCH cytochrome family protein
MSQIKKNILPVLVFAAGLLLMSGCGDRNPKAVLDGDTGQHFAGWLPIGHAEAAKADASVCTECHGADFSGGISGVACASCHVNGSPLTHTNCTSCHGNPPDGTVAPNRAGAHNTITGHFAAQVTFPDGCNTCHNGAGSGTLKHDNGVVDVAILSSYSSNSGLAVHNSDNTCSNVSCHGGQTTPNWLTGSINVSKQCTFCHVLGPSAGNPEYNSVSSGQHAFHVTTQGIFCTACHDTTKLSINHFTTLNTLTMEGPAKATISDILGYSTSTNDTCVSNCHSNPSVPRSWF